MAARRAAASEPRQFKVVLIGNSSVGKTCILKRFVKNEFKKEATTIAGHFLRKTVTTAGGTEIALNIWDTAGQERYFAVTRQFFRGANLACCVYDITNAKSFEGVPRWISKLKEECGNEGLVVALCGNKADLSAQREVGHAEGEALAKELGASFFEVSAATDVGVTEMFTQLAEALAAAEPSAEPAAAADPVIRLNPVIGPPPKESGCPC